MKTLVRLLLIFVATAGLTVRASMLDQFKTLQAQRRQAIIHVTGIIDLHFVAQFQNLLQQAVQAKDFATAATIRNELKTINLNIGDMNADSPAARLQLADYLTSHDWTWVDLYPKIHTRYHFRLTADGKIVHDPDTDWNWSSDNYRNWEIVSGNEFRVIQLNGISVFFRVDLKNNTLTLDKIKTRSDHQDKEILYGDQTHSLTTTSGTSETTTSASGTSSDSHFFGTKGNH